MDIFGHPIEDLQNAIIVGIKTARQELQGAGGSLIAEEGGVVDAILGRIFTTIDGATLTIDHAELKHPLMITFRLPKPIAQEK